MATVQYTARQELQARIQMTTEAIEFCKEDGIDTGRHEEVLATLQAELARLGDGEGSLVRYESSEQTRALTDRPAAGSRAANQFGTFEVKYASAKQTGFIKSLLNTRDLSRFADAVTLDIPRLRAQVEANQVNKKAASAIIERLLACPVKETPVNSAAAPSAAIVYPATDKQVGLIKRLAAEKAWFDGDITSVSHRSHAGFPVREVVEGRVISKRDASAAIDYLFGCAKMVTRTPAAPLEAGMYRAANGDLVRVYFGRQSGQMLAKKVVEVTPGTEATPASYEFEYMGKADRFVTADQQMSLEEAKAWGRATGTCCMCAAHLDDPDSIKAGIGPVCSKKF